MLKIKRYKLIGAAVLTFSILVVGCGGGKEREAVYMDRAQQYFDEENYDKAKIEVKNVMQINPNSADAKFLSGMIAEKEENFRAAFNNFNMTVELDPSHVEALNRLGMYYASGKNLEEARKSIETALEVEPKNPESLAMMASIYAGEDDLELAVEYAQQALAEDPGNVQAVTVLTAVYAESDENLALEIVTEGIANQSKNEALKVLKLKVLQRTGNTEEVISLFKELIAEYPDKLLYVYQLTSFYARSEDIPEDQRKVLSEQLLRDEIARKPDVDQLKIWLVELILRNDSQEAAVATLEEFVVAAPESRVLRDSLSNAYMTMDQPQKASDLYTPIIDSDPNSVDAINARIRLVGIARKLGEFDEADRLVEEVLEIDPENSNALIIRSQLRISGKQYAEVIPDLRVVLKNDPESETALLLLAMANEKIGATDLALDNFKAVLEFKPGSVPALVGVGRILLAKGEVESGQRVLESALKKAPGEPESTRLLVSIYSQQQNWDEALSISAKLVEQEQTMAIGYYLQGRIYLAKGDTRQAVTSLEKSIAVDDRVVESLAGLVNAYVQLKQYDTAIKFLDKHIEKNPDHTHARELLATVYANSGDKDKAVAILEANVERWPEAMGSYRLLIRIYNMDDNIRAIQPLLDAGLEKNPDVAGLYMLKAEVHQKYGETDQAIDTYEKLLKRSPDLTVAKNNLASLLLDHDLTENNVQRAAELSADLGATEVPAFLDTAGWVQYQLGNYPQSLALMQLAVERGGISGPYHYHLGMAYFKNDMLAEAKESLTQAVANDAESYAGKEDARKVLQQL